MTAAPLRLLIVDDSAFNRRSLADIFTDPSDVVVVGKAGDGEEALRLAASLRPDVITLDLEMPRMDGFTFLRILMARQPTPVIVVSSYSQRENVFKALELGALDFIAKPDRSLGIDATLRGEVLARVGLVRSMRLSALETRSGLRSPSWPAAAPRERLAPGPRPPRFLVAIASSTGGPTALLDLFGRLPETFPGAVLIAQHMPEKFTRTFAERLDRKGPVRVAEAQDNDLVQAGTAFVCPGRVCMELVSVMGGAELRLRVGPPGPADRYVPSGDRLLRSVALAAGARSLGVILTGMGDDGVLGAGAIRKAGGVVLAESEETAIVYGMPAAALRAGVVDDVLALPELGQRIAAFAP